MTRETVDMDTPARSATAWIPRLSFSGLVALVATRDGFALVLKRVRPPSSKTTLNDDDRYPGGAVIRLNWGASWQFKYRNSSDGRMSESVIRRST
jgi:hypothetical protein